MDISPLASKASFKICPLCEERRMVFSGLYSARCPACGYEPDRAVLKALRQIIALPEATGTARGHPNGNPEVGPPEKRRAE